MTPRFDLASYETVADRITRLLEAYEDARIVTEDLTTEQDRTGGIWRIKAYIYHGGQGANAYAAYENCETSAIGRAVSHALAGYSGDKKASASEMAKVNKGVTPAPARDFVAEAEAMTDLDDLRSLYNEAKSANVTKGVLAKVRKRAEDLK